MRHPGPIQHTDGVIDSGLPLVQGVGPGRGAGPPPGLGDRGGQRGRGVEGRVAGGRSRGHRRLDVAQRQVRALDVGLDLREHGREVIVAAAAQDPRPVEDRGVDQQVAARLDHQLDAGAAAAATGRRGRSRGGAARADRVAARAPGTGARARRDGQREQAGQHDRAPPPPGTARLSALNHRNDPSQCSVRSGPIRRYTPRCRACQLASVGDFQRLAREAAGHDGREPGPRRGRAGRGGRGRAGWLHRTGLPAG